MRPTPAAACRRDRPGGSEDPEFLHFEALVHDWIKSGALMFGSDRVFSAGFDDLR